MIAAGGLPGRLVRRIRFTPAPPDRTVVGDCWIWTGCTDRYGYGRAKVDGRNRQAHIVFWNLLRGSVPDGQVLDHDCRVRACVSPSHLTPRTDRENVMAGNSVPALNARKTECHRGHPFTATNTFVDGHGHRRCRTCIRNRTVSRRHAPSAVAS